MGKVLVTGSFLLIALASHMFAQENRPSSFEAFDWGADPQWKESWPKLPKKLPQECRIRRLLSSAIPFRLVEISETDCDREKEYTKYWLNRLLPQWFNSQTQAKAECAKVFQNDDGVLLEVRVRQMHIRAIDSRSMDAVFDGPEIGKRSIIENLKNVTSNVFDWDNPATKMKELESVDCGDNAEFKRILVKMNRSGPVRPVEVFQKGDVFIISFEKIISRKAQKVPVRADQAVGGIPLSDSRPWLRFEGSNREQLSAEYFKALQAELVERNTVIVPKAPGEETNAPVQIDREKRTK